MPVLQDWYWSGLFHFQEDDYDSFRRPGNPVLAVGQSEFQAAAETEAARASAGLVGSWEGCKMSDIIEFRVTPDVARLAALIRAWIITKQLRESLRS